MPWSKERMYFMGSPPFSQKISIDFSIAKSKGGNKRTEEKEPPQAVRGENGLSHVGVGSAFCFQRGGRAMTGIYLIIPGECGEPFQGFFDIIPIAGGEVCSAAGALKQGIAAENDILADKADGAYGMSGGFHYVKFHIADGYLIALGNQNIGVNDDGASRQTGNS